MENKRGIKARAQEHRRQSTEVVDDESSFVQENNLLNASEENSLETESNRIDTTEQKETSLEKEELNNDLEMASRDGKAKYKRTKQGKKKRRRRRLKRFFKFVVIMLLLGGIGGGIGYQVYQEKYGLSTEVMDLNEYYGITEESDDYIVILNNEVLEYVAKEEEGQYYLPYKLVNNKVNPKIYWDYKDELLLYSYAVETIEIDLNAQENLEAYTSPVAINESDDLYISMEHILMHTDVEFQVYNNPNRIIIRSDWEERSVVTVSNDTQVRYRGGVKSDILTEVLVDDVLELVEEGEVWTKVSTNDGVIGYVQNKNINSKTQEEVDRLFIEETYHHTLLNYKINMAWHQVTNVTSNGNLSSVLEGTKGLTTIAPTWFFLDDTAGTVRSLASQEYVDYAHEQGLDVWATLNDFDGNISSQSETYYLLSSTAKRRKVIDTVMEEVLKYGIDGINVDIELVSTDAGNHFIQFVRELSIECRKNGIILSVANYPPKSFNSHYEWAEQGDVVDYVIIMGYDEYYGGSKQAGPVASITYVEEGIVEMLNHVPAEQIINAVPFYTRIWAEVEKTEEEILEDEGTDNAEYSTKVSSSSYGMAGARTKAEQNGATFSWDYYTKNNYATWVDGKTTYKMWLEDSDSLREKLSIMELYDIAGVAAWKIGIEESGVWDVIQEYLQ